MVKEDGSDGFNEDDLVKNPAFVLPRLNTLYALAKEQIKNNDIDKASESYHRMLEVYNEVNRLGFSNSDKQAAYRKLTSVFTQISSETTEGSSLGFVPLGKYLFPVTFVVVILLIIFFVKPEFTMTGLAAFGGDNSAPYWSAGSTEIGVNGNTVVDLSNYFTDPDGDRLTYAVEGARNMDIGISGNMLTIYPYRKLAGERAISITASDSRESTKVSVTLIIG